MAAASAITKRTGTRSRNVVRRSNRLHRKRAHSSPLEHFVRRKQRRSVRPSALVATLLSRRPRFDATRARSSSRRPGGRRVVIENVSRQAHSCTRSCSRSSAILKISAEGGFDFVWRGNFRSRAGKAVKDRFFLVQARADDEREAKLLLIALIEAAEALDFVRGKVVQTRAFLFGARFVSQGRVCRPDRDGRG